MMEKEWYAIWMNHRGCVLSGRYHEKGLLFVKKRDRVENGEHSDGGTAAASWRKDQSLTRQRVPFPQRPPYHILLRFSGFHGQEGRATLRTLSTEGEHTVTERKRLHQVEKNTWPGSHFVSQPWHNMTEMQSFHTKVMASSFIAVPLVKIRILSQFYRWEKQNKKTENQVLVSFPINLLVVTSSMGFIFR